MDVNRSIHLLDLPNELLEKIVDHLPLVADRKNLRLTCKRLNNLLNCQRFCRQELIVWSEKSQNLIESSFRESTRSCFNLRLVDVTLSDQQVSDFFNQHGYKVRALEFIRCRCPVNLLEIIIIHCYALSSLKITYLETYTFSFSNTITRPTVTSLELILDPTMMCQSPDIFTQILSVFPNVKHLNLTEDRRLTLRTVPESVILDFVANFNHLESLKLNIRLKDPLNREKQFLDSLPKLKKLYLSFSRSFQESSKFWKTFASRLNTSSIELHGLGTVHSDDIISLSSVTNLKNLSYSVISMHFNIEVFKALVSSQLKTINLELVNISASDIPTDLPIANKTVTDMNLQSRNKDDELDDQSFLMVPFPTYFHGLIHLQTEFVSDKILHAIFKYQKNLRSLVLSECQNCSVAGFCGTVETQFENSISNLRKLEHLSLLKVYTTVIQSESFQTVLNFPRLKYLRITSYVFEEDSVCTGLPKIQVNMFKSCVNLEALCLEDFARPPSRLLSSLHQNLKHLNYLFLSALVGHAYVNLKHFYWTDLEQFRLMRYQRYYYDEILDRTVFPACARLLDSPPLYSPKISSHTVNWITLGRITR